MQYQKVIAGPILGSKTAFIYLNKNAIATKYEQKFRAFDSKIKSMKINTCVLT
jgi:hypothetical protein